MMKSVRARFKVDSVFSTAAEGEVCLGPIPGAPEDKELFVGTPRGGIKLLSVKTAVVELMKPGTEFYVDFTPAGPKTQPQGAAKRTADRKR